MYKMCTDMFSVSLRHLAGKGERKNLLKKVLSFPPCTPSILFQNFLCSLFHFALHAKMKKRDIRFENEEVQKGNARICLLSGMLSVCTVTLVDFKRILCKAQGAGKGIRTCTDLYGLVRTIGTWCSVCHALWNFDSTGLCGHCVKHGIRLIFRPFALSLIFFLKNTGKSCILSAIKVLLCRRIK